MEEDHHQTNAYEQQKENCEDLSHNNFGYSESIKLKQLSKIEQDNITQNSLFNTQMSKSINMNNDEQLQNECEFNIEEYLFDEQIAKKIEKDKLNQIYKAALDLKNQLAKNQGRCKICTLKPPCKHSNAEINQNQFQQTDQVGESSPYQSANNRNSKSKSINKDNLQINVPNNTNDYQSRSGSRRKISYDNNDLKFENQNQNPNFDFQNLKPQNNPFQNQKQLSEISQIGYNSFGNQKKSKVMKYKNDHHQIMSVINRGEGSTYVNEKVSPYSILRASAENDVDITIQKLTAGQGPRSNRAQLLKHLALKQKMDSNPFLMKTPRISKDTALKLGLDPHQNELNMQYQALNHSIYPNGLLPHQIQKYNQGQDNQMHLRGRTRNKRGEYQTINQEFNQINMSKRNSQTAGTDYQKRNSSNVNYETKKADNRLKLIEQISKYREERIKKEFDKLEQEMAIEEEKRQKEQLKEQRNQEYYKQQKLKLQEFQIIKQKQDQEQIKKEQLEIDRLNQERKRRKQLNEEIKQNIKMYKEYKSQQLNELQMREQGIIAHSFKKDIKNRGAKLSPINYQKQNDQQIFQENEENDDYQFDNPVTDKNLNSIQNNQI